MDFMTVMRQELEGSGRSFKDLARAVCVAPNTISTWFARHCIPDAMVGRVVEAIDSPRLSEMRCSQCEGNTFPTRYLDNVDEHPMVAIDKFIEEIDEWTTLSRTARLILINRRKGTQFSGEEDVVLRKFEDETADVITAAKTVLIRLQECYNRPVHVTMQRHVEKLERAGYCEVMQKRAIGRM